MANGAQAHASHEYVQGQDIKLADHFKDMLNALDKRIDERFIAQEKISTVAWANINDRLEHGNDYRQAMSDQAKAFITRADHELLISNISKDMDKVCDDIDSLKLSRAELAGKASQGQLYISTAIGLLGLLTGIISLALRMMGK